MSLISYGYLSATLYTRWSRESRDIGCLDCVYFIVKEFHIVIIVSLFDLFDPLFVATLEGTFLLRSFHWRQLCGKISMFIYNSYTWPLISRYKQHLNNVCGSTFGLHKSQILCVMVDKISFWNYWGWLCTGRVDLPGVVIVLRNFSKSLYLVGGIVSRGWLHLPRAYLIWFRRTHIQRREGWIEVRGKGVQRLRTFRCNRYPTSGFFQFALHFEPTRLTYDYYFSTVFLFTVTRCYVAVQVCGWFNYDKKQGVFLWIYIIYLQTDI